MKKEDAITTIEFGLIERILQFYLFHKRKVHSYLATLLGLSVLFIGYLTSGPSAEDAVQAKKNFENWKKAPLDQNLKAEMSKSLKKIAGLERAKESEIAQILLSAGQIEPVETLARQCIERLREESPFHAAYAETTLNIEKKEFQKALEASVALKAQMERDLGATHLRGRNLAGGCTLYASNLLRIALLQKQVGNAPGELSAWEEVRGLLDMQEDSVAAQLLKMNFGGNGFSLTDFISQRERSIVH
jgi:hypothetical protein